MRRKGFFSHRTKLSEAVLTELFVGIADENSQSIRQLANCLIPLLNAVGWRGDPRHVAEAVPHFVKLNKCMTPILLLSCSFSIPFQTALHNNWFVMIFLCANLL